MHKQVKQWADAKVQFNQNQLVTNERFHYGSHFETRAATIPKNPYLINQLTQHANIDDEDYTKTRNLNDP